MDDNIKICNDKLFIVEFFLCGKSEYLKATGQASILM